MIYDLCGRPTPIEERRNQLQTDMRALCALCSRPRPLTPNHLPARPARTQKKDGLVRQLSIDLTD